MKILLTSDITLDNPLISGYSKRLNNHLDLTVSIDAFWNKDDLDFDIIHIQWPEQLFQWKNSTIDDMKKLENQLKYWKKKGTKLVITRHNIFPHDLNELYIDIYKLIFENVDIVIHFSQASIENFNTIYKNSLKNPKLTHEVIYHPIYEDISNTYSKEKARKVLNIRDKKRVILVFGSIRHDKERSFIKSVFNNLDIKNKYLIVPRFYNYPPRKKTIFKWLIFFLKRLKERIFDDYLLGYNFVKEEEIQLYMNAADVVFIPRFEVLNSGVLVLAYSFNKIVVGPSTGSIGEILDRSNNPSFLVGDLDDAILKVKKGLMLSQEKVENLEFAKEHMNWQSIIAKHLKLYENCLIMTKKNIYE